MLIVFMPHAWHFYSRGNMRRVVWQAYDVDENRYVACKIHQLVPQWTEEHKRSYVRHAVRPRRPLVCSTFN